MYIYIHLYEYISTVWNFDFGKNFMIYKFIYICIDACRYKPNIHQYLTTSKYEIGPL